MSETVAATNELPVNLPGHVQDFGKVIIGLVHKPPTGFDLITCDPRFSNDGEIASKEVTPDYPHIPAKQLSFWRSSLVVASVRLPGERSEDGHPTAEVIHLFQNGDLTRFVYQYPVPINVRLAAARLHVDKTDDAKSSGLNPSLIAIIRQNPKDYLKGKKPLLVESVVGVPKAKLERITEKLSELIQP